MYQALIIPDISLIKNNPNYGLSLKLVNDGIHYLLIDKSIFKNIQHDYSMEFWFKINWYEIITKDNNNFETTINPSLFHFNDNLQLQCNNNFILLNDQPITRYQKGQWHHIALVLGNNGVINSSLSKIYVNGQLINKQINLLPTLNDIIPIIGESKINLYENKNRYVILNKNDDQQLEWAIFKLYNRALQPLEIYQNYMSLAQRFGLNINPPQAIIYDNLLVYFDMNNYKSPNLFLSSNDIKLPYDNLKLTSDNVKFTGKKNKYMRNIYTLNNMSETLNTDDLSKLISQLLTRKYNSQTIVTQPTMPELIFTKSQPNNNLNTLQIKNPIDLSLIMDQNKPKYKGLEEIKSNPKKIALLQQFFINYPQTFVDILSNSNLTSEQLTELSSLIIRKNNTIDTFTDGSLELNNYVINEPDEKIKLNESIKQLNLIISELNGKDHKPKIKIENNKQNYETAILNELKALRKDIANNDKKDNYKQTPIDTKQYQLSQITNIEWQLQKLLQSNIISDKTNQLQLLQLLKNFQNVKNNILINNTEWGKYKNYDQLMNKLSNIDMKLKNMTKTCLHAPNVRGFVSDGVNQVGIIDHTGDIDYIPECNHKVQNQPYYIALRNSQRQQDASLPHVIDNINRNPNKNQQLIGQITDSTQQLCIGVIVKKGEQQYLISVNPVPKLMAVPILAISYPKKSKKFIPNNQTNNMNNQTNNQTNNTNNQTNNMNNQMINTCPQNSQKTIFQGDIDWSQPNSIAQINPQILNGSQFDFLDKL